MSFFFLTIIDRLIGLRVSLIEEIIGADIVEHGIGITLRDLPFHFQITFDK